MSAALRFSTAAFAAVTVLAPLPAWSQAPASSADGTSRIRLIEESYDTATRGLDWSTEPARQASARKLLAASKERTAATQAEGRRRGLRLELKSRASDPARLLRLEPDGHPRYEGPDNVIAQITTGVSLFQGTGSNGPGGAGFRIGIWDGGAVRPTHVEFNNTGSSRIDLGGDTQFMSNHATHVGGTLAAYGVATGARGMAPLARLLSYDSADDTAEAAGHGATSATDDVSDKICVSNHSYSTWAGWRPIETPPKSGTFVNTWLGKKTELEDSTPGLYGADAVAWDDYCTTHEYHLPFRSAGNNRGNGAPATGGTFQWADGTPGTYNAAIHPPGNNSRGGWDLIGSQATAKNVITIGAVSPAVAAGVRSVAAATITTFSSWGPTDDGRIKPDVVADGLGLYSSIATGDSDYDTYSGTSMATPNACGTALLIQEHYRSANARIMRAATLKALIIHTADDLGSAGPNYDTGWGLMNAAAARTVIDTDTASPEPVIVEAALEQGEDYTFPVFFQPSSNAKITLCWTDPAGTARSTLDDTTRNLINDLDLRLTHTSGSTTTTHQPWVLNPSSPAQAATKGDNIRDNVEQVMATPTEGVWWVHVTHKGTLTDGPQKFSLIVSGHNTVAGVPSMHITGPLHARESVQSYNPHAATFGITNTGGGQLKWTVVSEVPWLTPSPASGTSFGEKDEVTLTFTSSGLPAGNHSGTVRVQSPGRPDKSVIVFLTQRGYVTIPEGLDAPALTWSGIGWTGHAHEGDTWDGEDAVRVAPGLAEGLAPGTFPSVDLRANITGPARLQWRWRNDTTDPLYRFTVWRDGVPARYINGNFNWQAESLDIPAGTHLICFSVYGQVSSYLNSMSLVDSVAVIYPPVVPPQTITGFAGQPVTFQCAATNDPTVWALSSGLTGLTINASSGLITGTPPAALNTSRTLTATNAAGSGNNNLSVVIHASTTLQAAVENADLNLLANSDTPWFGQTLVTHDGVDAARSGAIGDNAQSNMAFTVTGPIAVRWWWKVSSEANYDRLRVLVDGVESENISGEVNWETRTMNLGAGTHTVTFRYTKDANTSAGSDAGWVDQLEMFELPVIGPFRVAIPGAPAATTGIPYSWRLPFSGNSVSFSATGLPAPLTIGSTTGTINGTPAAAGTYTINITATNPAGTDTQAISLTIAAPIPLDQAVESEGILTWSTGGTYNMVGIPGDDFYARDAARSGPITHSQQSWMQTSITGPALVTWLWQCESEGNFDKLRCLLDGTEQFAISGLVPTETRSLAIPTGVHTLRFSYDKDASVSERQDAGYVERVSVLYPPVFTSSAVVSGWTGQDVLHTIAVNNADTLTCGTLPSGLVFDAATRTISGSATSSGTFSPLLTATNAAGSTTQTLSLTITPAITIPTAIDWPLITTWATGGSAPWFGQAAVSNDGVDAARAGILAPGEYLTWMSATVTGPARLSWKWKVKSTAGRDLLIARLDGLEDSVISGDVNWTDGSMIIPAGSHSVRFEYLKSGDDFTTGEGAWVDQFVRHQPPAVLVFTPPSGVVGTAFSYTIGWVQGAPTGYGASGLPPGLSLNAATGLISGTPTHPGVYPVTLTASNLGGSSSATTNVTITAPFTLPAALDSTLTWTTSGPAWFGQGMTTRDGVDAARCGIVRESVEGEPAEASAMQTTVTGPGYLTGYARTDSEQDYDALRITRGSTGVFLLSGQTGWQRFVIPVPEGTHTIRFAYTKDTSVTVGQDTAWVDQVTWSTTGIRGGPILVGSRSFQLTYGTAPGVNAQLQTSTDLINWTNIGSLTPGTGADIVHTTTYAASSRRFWRVQETVAP